MTVKRIDIGLFAQDEDAKRKVNDLRLHIDGLRNVAKDIKFAADDKEFSLQVKEAFLKLDRLDKRVARPSVKLDGLRAAEVAIDRVDAKLDRLNHKSVDIGGGGFFHGAINVVRGLTTTKSWRLGNWGKLTSGELGNASGFGQFALSPLGGTAVGAGAVALAPLAASLIDALAGVGVGSGVAGIGGLLTVQSNPGILKSLKAAYYSNRIS